MYIATKDGSSCRIPDKKAAYYKSMGYTLENLDKKVGKSTNTEASPDEKSQDIPKDVKK